MIADVFSAIDAAAGPGGVRPAGLAFAAPTQDPAGFDALVRASSGGDSAPRIRALDSGDAADPAPLPDVAADAPGPPPLEAARPDAEGYAGLRLGEIFSQAAASLERAQAAERAVAGGGGSVLEMSVERAKANAVLGVASAAASKISTALSTFVNMAV